MTSPYHAENSKLHQKNNALFMLAVNPKKSAPGNYVVFSVRFEAKPGDPVVIVVARKL